jgi:hypothetical protein
LHDFFILDRNRVRADQRGLGGRSGASIDRVEICEVQVAETQVLGSICDLEEMVPFS